MTVRVTAVPLYVDPRGAVAEPLEPDALGAQRNVHVVWTEPGAVRGNHYHVHGTEVMTVRGPALVRYREGAAVRDVVVGAAEALRFEFPPGVAHAVRNTGDRTLVLVSFNTVAFDPAKPDVVRDVLIAPSGPA